MYTADALRCWNLTNARVFLRIDANVPCDNGGIIDDFKLIRSMKTISWIINSGGSLLVATHMGKDQTTKHLLSTQLIADWLTAQGVSATYAPTYAAAFVACRSGARCVVLENERLSDVVQPHDTAVSQICSYYVNDAFGSLHRTSWSLSQVPQLFEQSAKSIGFLVEDELRVLAPLTQDPEHPFVIIAGGNKKEKLIILEQLAHRADTFLLCPALSNIVRSDQPIESSEVNWAVQRLLTTHKNKLHLPIDYCYSRDAQKDTPEILSIGEKTAQQYCEIIASAKTVVFNGLGGFLNIPESLHTTAHLFQAMASSSGISLVAGGDSSAAARALGFGESMSLVSTGGGATMYYLANGNLPALAFLTDVLKHGTKAE